MKSDFETLVNLRDGIAKMKKAVDEMKDAKDEFLPTCKNPKDYEYCMGELHMLQIMRTFIERLELEGGNE